MNSVEFIVSAVPVAQPRQRHAMIAGHLRNYTPTTHPVNAFKAACQLACPTSEPFQGPVYLDLLFVLPRPQSMIWKRKPMPRVPHWKKPDTENLVKSTQDSLSGKLFRDDSQVAHLVAHKVISAGNEQPHVVIKCGEMG